MTLDRKRGMLRRNGKYVEGIGLGPLKGIIPALIRKVSENCHLRKSFCVI